MIPRTPSFLVAAAAGFVGLNKQRGDAGDPGIAIVLRGVRQRPGTPWCAAFVHHVGYWSHFDFGMRSSSWPLPLAGSCALLGAFARSHGVLVPHPAAGDVFLLFSDGQGRFTHAGIVTRLIDAGVTDGHPWIDCDVIEGIAVTEGGSERRGVRLERCRFRPSSGDRFIRWAELDSSFPAERRGATRAA